MWSIVDQIWGGYKLHEDVESLREEILTSPWYEQPSDADDSLLRLAIGATDLEAVRMLLSIGERPSVPSKDGSSLLHQAVDHVSGSSTLRERDRALAILASLLDYGADPNVYGMDGSPLHRAAGAGCIDAAQILLSHGANIEMRTLVDGERTPLIHAALMQQPKMVRFLLSAGASKNTAISCTLTDGPTTLQEVLTKENTPVSKDILSALNSM
ncbi:ankyrin repeat domain-containing protein [Schlesneria paludicola]|uniref:ankyrin repeat domain-containing protein n=1 Tax=Schlesneria paludicola TaxID=360056 RepID=UPI00029A323B|nr:ankyrin repeat domain-containing protein [Schlesneria paludicola]